MKKSLLLLCLTSILASMSVKASCLDVYKENNMLPSEGSVTVGALLSTTGVGLAVGGLELASMTSAAGATLMADSDNIIVDLIGLDLISDASSSATEAVYYGSSSTLAATGIVDGSRKSYRTEINLIEEAYLAPEKLGTNLLELTDDINDIRTANEGKVSAKEVARVIVNADGKGFFCEDEDDLMDAVEIRDYVDHKLR